MNKPSSPNQFAGLSRRQLLLSAAAGAVASVGMMGASAAHAQAPGSGRLVVNGLDTSVPNKGFIDLLRQGGVDCVHKSVGDLASIASYYGWVWENPDQLALARTVADIRQAQAAGKMAVILGSQVASEYEKVLYSRTSVLGSFDDMTRAIRDFRALGVGIQGLCYNTTNVFGSGCLDHAAPLTRAGQKLVEQLHQHRILVDVGGHCGERTSLDAIEMSSGVPIVCTHTNFAALNPNIRAISDRLAEAIARTGGVIGITAISAFHTRHAGNMPQEDVQATLDQHLDHYDYARKLVGAEHVGLGPDFIWGWGETMEMKPEDSAAFPPYSLPDGIQSTVKGFEDTSKLPNLIAGLKDRGWSEGELDLLLGGNWLRVYERVWGA